MTNELVTTDDGKKRLPVITASSGRCYRRCQREYYFRVELGYCSTERAGALQFGSAIHLGIETLLTTNWDVCFAIGQATETIDDPFDVVKLEVLIAGYAARWRDEPLTIASVEQEFRAPLINPDTGAASKTWDQAGKLDEMARDQLSNDWIVEHKTSSEDISAGSVYWEKLRIDSQVSTYYVGARSLGYSPAGVLYDVIKKPTIKPLKATPIESRKYKKDGELYANQREFDETPDEYKARLIAIYSSEPDKHFVRGEVVRLETEEVEAARDTWHIAKAIRESQLANRWPRNPEACERYHRFCEFWPVCTKASELTDARYTVKKPHQELEVVA